MSEIRELASQIYCSLVTNLNYVPSIIDDDVVLDPLGEYVKVSNGSYIVGTMYGLSNSKEDRYKVITTLVQRIIRESYKLAKEFIEESHLKYDIE